MGQEEGEGGVALSSCQRDSTGGGFSNATYGVVGEFEGVLRGDGADNSAPNMYETTDLEVNTNGLEDEDYNEERSTWGCDEDDYNETAPVSVVNPKFGGVLPTDDVGNRERSAIHGVVATDATSSADTGSAEGEGSHLGYGINPVKEKGCDGVSTLPVVATSDGEDKMNGTTVEAKDTKCAGAHPSRDGENLVERSGLAGEGEHSDDEDPADGALSTLSGDAEMVRAEVVAGVTEAGLVLKPQVEEDRSESAVENAPSLDRLFTSEELDLLMEGETLGVSEEREEYEKELEERLYPLDEVELKLRMEKNAEQQQELSLEEIDSILNIPVETLARTRESSPGELSTPEYWLSWYKKTLAVTEEARRANRNLQGAEPAGGKTDRVGAVSLTASDGRDVGGGDVIGDELLQAGCDPVPVHGEVDKSVVRGNILICMKGTAVSTSKADGDEKALHGSRFYMLSTVDWYG
ncbi:hypothetical protein PF004_g16630 [Phytophthora fragariae]|uniref:Uncharacterized protein n=2 Tax=Phytophthora fragariae TaxID=53985 RepID=A0A6G0NHR0_9STRA|nr:hypothetical protein PF004_g16630 [Phytophthora fragariae]